MIADYIYNNNIYRSSISKLLQSYQDIFLVTLIQKESTAGLSYSLAKGQKFTVRLYSMTKRIFVDTNLFIKVKTLYKKSR